MTEKWAVPDNTEIYYELETENDNNSDNEADNKNVRAEINIKTEINPVEMRCIREGWR